MTNRNAGQRPWSFRRWVVVWTLAFCAAAIGKVALWGHPTPSIGEAVVTGAFGLAGAVIGSYIFGAVWHDRGGEQ